MKTTIEDNELNVELQELYIIASHWIADLNFFRKDIEFLKRLFSSTIDQIAKHESYAELIELSRSIAEIEKVQLQLRNNIASYRDILNSCVKDYDTFLDLNLLETHALLEREIADIMLSFKSLKGRVYSLHNAEDVRYVKQHQLCHQLI